jgi:hypothetical protein
MGCLRHCIPCLRPRAFQVTADLAARLADDGGNLITPEALVIGEQQNEPQVVRQGAQGAFGIQAQ